jgi:LPXTG-motif cell wall-anchored protein
MKLRRAMAAAAATAVMAPLALLSAPAAFATGEPDTSTSSPAEDTSSPATDTSSPATDTSSPAEDTSSPATDTSSPATDTNSPATDTNAPAKDTGSPATDTGSPAASSSPSPSPSAGAPEDEDPELCVDEDGHSTAELSTELRSGLSGLPETIVAGSGWTAFSFNVSNRGDEAIKDIKPMIGVAAMGWEDFEDYSGRITVQVFNTASGSWETIAANAGEGGTFDSFSLGAGRSVSYKMRLNVSGKVPDSLAVTIGFAQYADDKGCWVADDPNGWIYFFDILAAGSDAGDPNDAKPQGGRTDLTDVNEVSATGTLAETGSSSALPMIGLVGGFAVVAGAGAVFVVRRRKAGAQA